MPFLNLIFDIFIFSDELYVTLMWRKLFFNCKMTNGSRFSAALQPRPSADSLTRQA
jgi:hypothetical protein